MRKLPGYAPPKPKVPDGLRAVLSAVREQFATEAFKKGLAFVKVGLAKSIETGNYQRYTGQHAPADSALQSADGDGDEFRLGEVAAAVEMEARPAGDEGDE